MTKRERKDTETGPAWAPMGSLIGADPTRAYVLANSEDSASGSVAYYEMLGYRVERATAGGPRISMGSPVEPGDPMRFQGHVLVSCSLERKRELDARGPDGTTGRNLSHAIQARISSTGLQQGIDGRVARVVSETSPLMVEG